jgi:glucan 1,3-beta-glucosidase
MHLDEQREMRKFALAVKPLQTNHWAACWLAVGAALGLLVSISINTQPKPLADAASAVLPCLSYAPFRRPGASPFDPNRAVTPAEIEADLTILRRTTACIRTYGVGNGLDAVPSIAQRLGFQVHQGVWLGRDHALNDVELRKAIALAQQFPGTIASLVVGNEVLLRRDLLVHDLEKALVYAKSQTAVPISYADVWEFWLQNASLARHVDVVTIHILPYWEDDPVAVSEAVDHVFDVARRVRTAFDQKPVWIGETGWPSNGRQRAGAVPGQWEQTRFFRELLLRAGQEPLAVNFIEAFDQPWKRALEGAMGGHWGLFDANGEAKVALTGTVAPSVEAARDARRSAVASGLILLAGLLACWRTGSAFAWVASGIIATLAICLVAQWRFMSLWNRTDFDWWSSGTALLVTSTCIVTLLCARRRLQQAASILLSITLFMAASHALLLMFDGRYRGFSWALYLPVTIATLCMWLYRMRLAPSSPRRLLSVGLLALAPLVGIHEGFTNGQAWRLVLIWLLLGFAAFHFSGGSDSQSGERG